MSAFVIEKNVPLPPRKARSRAYPLREMQVGDSFLFTGDDKDDVRRARASIMAIASRIGIKVSCRADGNAMRVWRTA